MKTQKNNNIILYFDSLREGGSFLEDSDFISFFFLPMASPKTPTTLSRRPSLLAN